MVQVFFKVIFILVACCETVDLAQDSKPIASPKGLGDLPTLTSKVILRNTPTNSDKRCVGISLVVEALLEGEQRAGADASKAEDVAQQIYSNVPLGRKLRYPQHVLIEKDRVSIASTRAINKLGAIVADQYKLDSAQLNQTEAGRQKLWRALNRVVTNQAELDRILSQDQDKTEVFLGKGIRTFADGTVKQTYHAFLINQQPDGAVVVYDPNDPGKPIQCKLQNTREGLTVEWTCKYRDTGKRTTQRYQIVPKGRFFRIMKSG